MHSESRQRDEISDPADLLASFHLESETRLTASERRQDQFKRTTNGDQTKRREKLLRRQRKQRRDLTTLARSLALEEEVIDEPPQPATKKDKRKREEEEETARTSPENSNKIHRIDEEFVEELRAEKRSKRKERIEERVRVRYQGTFMLPEEMDEMPLDLVESWVCVPLPKGGKRCLVIAAKGQTTSRLRNGAVLHRFSSTLPSGNTAKGAHPAHYCILDCFFHEPSLTYYVIDIQCWRGNLYYDCDTSFRSYWLHTKLQEIPGVDTISRQNEFRFVPLPQLTPSVHEIQSAIAGEILIDGLLFYHKEAVYTFGVTPLVLYLAQDRMDAFLASLKNEESQMTLTDDGS